MAALTNILRVASWNVHEGLPIGADGPTRATKKELLDLILCVDADVLGLQEVDFDGAGRSNVLDTIRENTHLVHVAHHVLSESSFIPAAHAGVALVSRFPLKNQQRYRFPNPELGTLLNGSLVHTHDKGLVSATVMLPDRSVSAVSLHAFPFHLFNRDAGEPDFRSIWTALSTELATFATGSSLIVCGDFNTEKRDLILAHEEVSLERSMKDRPTYKRESFDDVLFSSDFRIVAASTIDNFSDHRICVVEFV